MPNQNEPRNQATPPTPERQLGIFPATPAPAQRAAAPVGWHRTTAELQAYLDRRAAQPETTAELSVHLEKQKNLEKRAALLAATPPAKPEPDAPAATLPATETTSEPRKAPTMAKYHVRWQESDHGHGRMPYCHSDPSIAVELEFPEGTPRETIRAQIAATLELIRTELVAQVVKARPPAPEPRETGEADDIGPGDPAYERRQTEYDPKRDNQAQPERRREEPRQEQRREEPRRDDRRSEPRRDDRGGGQQRQRGGDKGSWLDTDRVPDRASQLYGYAKDLNAMGWFKAWARRVGAPNRQFKDWEDRDVADSVREYLAAGRPEDAPRDESRSNGYAGANGRN